MAIPPLFITFAENKSYPMNSDVIKLLPDSVANQIAAGEVIQRPASVIKELVENAVDAGADNIQIIIKDAGRTLIQVVDNGCGMTPSDARMAFERHATSKITSAADLFTLHTMGFRGEALPSIAAVAQIDLRTTARGSDTGTRLCLSESKFVSQEPAPAVPGTNLMVKNLFFHMPARRKFLKKDSVELSHILHEFERLALVNTGVSFTIVHNDVTLHQLPAGTLKSRIGALFGKTLARELVSVETESTVARISGFVSLPAAARKRGAPQYFFVNGRNMRHPYFHKAVLSCYSELISADVQPAYFINFEVDPATIDVNIHPQKHEIKFENEQAIWQILVAAVKQALGRINAAGGIDFDADQAPDIPVFMPDRSSEMPDISIGGGYNPFDESDRQAAPRTAAMQERRSRASVPHDWEELYKNFTARRDAPAETEPGPDEAPAEAPLMEVADEPGQCISLHDKYIVLPSRSGLMVIDRRRAHIRVLYDKIMERLATSPLATQQLIFPEMLSLSPSRSAILEAAAPSLARLGFDISFLGDGTWNVSGVPSLPSPFSPVEALQRIITDIEETGQGPDETVLSPAATVLARAAAIAPGQELSQPEVNRLVENLMQSSQPDFTPDGLRVISIITHDQISKLFL